MITLYLKEHQETGLRYLGYTEKVDPISYKGSGKYWLRHIKKHGYDVKTTILFQTEDRKLAKEIAKDYSERWDVANNPYFANLKTEEIDGGIPNKETRAKIGQRSRERIITDEARRNMSASRKRHILTDEHKANIGKSITGRPVSLETRMKLSESAKKRVLSEEHRRKISEAKKGEALSDKHKASISMGNKGKPKSESHRKNLAIAADRRYENVHSNSN